MFALHTSLVLFNVSQLSHLSYFTFPTPNFSHFKWTVQHCYVSSLQNHFCFPKLKPTEWFLTKLRPLQSALCLLGLNCSASEVESWSICLFKISTHSTVGICGSEDSPSSLVHCCVCQACCPWVSGASPASPPPPHCRVLGLHMKSCSIRLCVS